MPPSVKSRPRFWAKTTLRHPARRFDFYRELHLSSVKQVNSWQQVGRSMGDGRATPAPGNNLSSVSSPHQQLINEISAAFQKPYGVTRVLHGTRRIEQGSRGKRTSLFPSAKAGGSIPLESRLELAHAIMLERSSTVLEYRTQAIKIPLPCGGSAYPDFVVRLICGRFEVHEVKPSILNLSARDTSGFQLLKALLAQLGIQFRLIDTASLPCEKALREYLFRYSRGHIQKFSSAQVELAKGILCCADPCSFVQAYGRLAQHDLPPSLADYLQFHQIWLPDNPAQLPNRGGRP